MSKTKYAVRYYSKTGHTKQLAEAIAQTLGCEAKTTAERIREYTDILFLGGAIYAGALDENVKGFIEYLDKTKIGKVILFGDATIMDPCKKMRAMLNDRGLPAETEAFCCKGSFYFLCKNHPNETDLKNAADFAKKWME